MNILAFVYDFPHQKSFDGVLELLMLGHKVTCIAQPHKELKVPKSEKRVFYKDLKFRKCDILEPQGYYINDHDSPWVTRLIERSDFDCAIILGARVLKNKETINALPIINFHPGLLPINRGLDNLKWAILKDQPQGVTSHVISDKIDEGKLIERRLIEVYEDDTYLDIFLRLLNLQIQMIENAVKMCKQARPLPKGFPYRSAVCPLEDARLPLVFNKYRSNYQSIKERYLEHEKNLNFKSYMEPRENDSGMFNGEFEASRF